MSFNENAFRHRVDKALETVRQVLERVRSPVYPADVQHTYSDKFVLANLLVRLALGSTLQGLTTLGIAEKDLDTLFEWSKDKTVSLRFIAEERCAFVKETVREQESATRTETTGHFASLSFGASQKTVTQITEYVWTFTGNYQLVAFRGVGAQAADQVLIKSREYSREIITGSKSNPRVDSRSYSPAEVDISWLLSHLAADRSVNFEINRDIDTCRTPRRNKDVNDALAQLTKLAAWSSAVQNFFRSSLFPVAELGLSDKEKRLDLAGINTDVVFVPVVPLLIEEPGAEPGSLTFKPGDVMQFLEESNRSLVHKISAVAGTLPSGATHVITGAEAQICICLSHLSDVCSALGESVDYVEHMLRQQLYAAVGKHITADDFGAYNRFHNRKLFRDGMQPLPFSFAVRRSPRHSPEGSIAIETAMSGVEEPVYTHVRGGKAVVPMHFHINAATRVQFKGERFLHAWLMHAFSGQGQVAAALTAQARQLSSFIVVIGRISSADSFEPKHALIVQNKDEFKIPLDLETIPTPKEFKDAIESLSPEQQDLCKAWRAMQLESTLFAVAVIQIKPLLERVLNLPPESLSKEIKLTQDLTELFIKYQIPADLLTAGTIEAAAAGENGHEGATPASVADKVAEVKGHVAAMYELIEGEKKKQLTDAAQSAVHDSLRREEIVFDDARWAQPDMQMEFADVEESLMEPQSFGSRRPRERSMLKAKTASRSAPSHPEMLAARATPAGMAMPAQAPPPPPPPPPPPKSLQQPQQQPHQRPQQEPKQEPKQEPQQEQGGQGGGGGGGGGGGAGRGVLDAVDYTTLPGILDGRLTALDAANAVRPTIITAGERWTKKAMASLMSKEADTSSLGEEELRGEKTKAFELLDALTRSGALVVEEASLHVVIAATHTFDKSLVDTVVQDNVNPVVQVERSSLIMASSVMGLPAASLIRDDHRPRVQSVTPALFDDAMVEDEASRVS